jgi:dolichol-phosphate mannosyltransferase
MKSLIAIPTYNEKENIIPLISEIMKYVDSDIFVIDDNSPDGTAQVIKDNLSGNRVKLCERPKKLGLATAYIHAFKYAIDNDYDYIFTMDADFSHNPNYLQNFLEKIKEADLVIGSRYISGGGIKNWSKFRLFVSKCGNFYARTILGIPIKDVTGGFKCYRISALKKINLDKIKSEGYSFLIEMKYLFYKNKFNVKEIPIVFEERREGQSKMSKKIFFEAMRNVWKFRFTNSKRYIK